MSDIPPPLGHDEDSQREKEKQDLAELLYKEIMAGNWEEVTGKYREKFGLAYSVQINQLEDTALHLAISHGLDSAVEKLVKIICDNNKEALKLKNKNGNTPLHVAASMGTLKMCIGIAKADPLLGIERNNDGETPLFLAALHGERDIFLQLHSICCCMHDSSSSHDSLYRNNSGETILHCAIKRECWGEHFSLLKVFKFTYISNAQE